MYTFLKFFSLILLASAQNNENVDLFEKLSSINDQWLKSTSIPESAFLLKNPPYSYHTELYLSPNKSDVSELSTNKIIPDCLADLYRISSHLSSGWALQMLDSDGKPSSGLAKGGVIWPGHFGECVSTYAPADGETYSPFHGQYCVTSWSLNISETYSNVPLTIGLCFPDSCSEEYISIIGKDTMDILDHIPRLKSYTSHLTLKSVSCKLKEQAFDSASIIYLIFISMFVCLSVFATAFIVYKNYKTSMKTPAEIFAENILSSSSCETTEINRKNAFPSYSSLEKNSVINDKAALVSNKAIIESSDPKSVFERLCQCFSMVENGKKILVTKSSGGQLLSIHGIRFLSLTWVILGHTFITSISIIGNRLDVLKLMDTFAFQMLLQAPFSVDSFFLLSGFLLSYLFLKDADKRNGKINWIYFYLHRIWRLTPAYMVVVFFYFYVFKYLGSGPFWEDHHCDANRGSWWKYVLYINNFIPIKQMCVGWSWYLANDMQFYIISPLFLYPLWRWPVAGFSVMISILLGSWITTATLSYHYDLIPMFLGALQAKDFDAYAKQMWDSFDLIYDKPYCRIAPYIIGVSLGYILYRLNFRKNFLNWWQQLLGWSFAAFFGLSVVFGLYHVNMSATTAMFYNSLCRSSFSLCLAWLIFACETGHAGFINTFLSWKLWIPLSRLTYCAYLIHPIFIHAYYQSYQSEFIFTNYIAVTSFLGFLLMSYASAFLFSILFESPLMNLEKLLLKGKRK